MNEYAFVICTVFVSVTKYRLCSEYWAKWSRPGHHDGLCPSPQSCSLRWKLPTPSFFQLLISGISFRKRKCSHVIQYWNA